MPKDKKYWKKSFKGLSEAIRDIALKHNLFEEYDDPHFLLGSIDAQIDILKDELNSGDLDGND